MGMMKRNNEERYLTHKLNVLVLQHFDDERFKPILKEIIQEKIEQYQQENRADKLALHKELLQHLLKTQKHGSK